ncbi:MAG TPA: DUF4214 domain-containing protein [Candidatus Dormibacteraeota bacterium]|nr:DUF4214 domain-containing protein [Candidatus Dormibacteraeota bacterium]
MPWHVAAAIAGTITVAPATLPPDGKLFSHVTVVNSACNASIGAGTATLHSDDGAQVFTVDGGTTFTATPTITFSSSGAVAADVRATTSPGLKNIWAEFTPGAPVLILGGTPNCTGQTAPAQLTQAGAPAAVTLDAPAPARLQVSTPATRAHVIAHVVDAQQGGIPGQRVFLVRNGDGANAVAMTDAGGGTYTADVAPAAGPRSEPLIGVDVSVSPNLQSAPRTLNSVSSNADCATAGGGSGLGFTPAALTADGRSSSVARATFANGAGHPAAGEPVSFSGDPGLNITGASATTDTAGVATATVHSGYSVGTKTVTVTDPSSLAACTRTLTVVNGTAGARDSGQLSRFIYRAYTDVLHRRGEDAGVEYFGNFVTFGGSRGQVALTFTTTSEYLTNVVNGTYQTYLGRSGDAGGVGYWVGQLQNGGTTDEQLAALFISSDEFYAGHGGIDSGWVDGLYRVVLGRSADPDGRANWLAALQNGWSRTQVAYAFTGSTEQLTQRVIGYYSTFLNRGPGSIDDVNYWVNAMQRGVHDENVMAAFIGSQEYFDRS